MRKFYIILICILSSNLYGQNAFHNFGNVQIHQDGEVGFHINLINDGAFNQNLGLAGFYNQNNELTISGTEIPKFYNMEVDIEDHLFLEINAEVENDLTYINGDVITPRLSPSISLDFLSNSIYGLENDLRNTDGYVSFSGNDSFIFPIGDDDKLRPLITPFQTGNPKFTAAYFNEDPNFPSTFSNSFNTSSFQDIIKAVNTHEFWDFNGIKETSVTLTWDGESFISELTTDLNKLRVVGWHKRDNSWKDLGNTNTTGSTTVGTITSIVFNPENYEVITFGSLIDENGITVYDVITPNGDGNNDIFVIEGIELFKSKLQIFNRWGVLVYEAIDYDNSWGGVSGGRSTISKTTKLPTGTYFYVLELIESGKQQAGPIYIKN